MPVVLVVDDSGVDRKLAARILDEAGFETRFATDGQRALDELGEIQPDMILTDMQMPNIGGLDLVRFVSDNHPTLPIVLMTGHGSEELAVEALRTGAASYVPKRNLARDLVETVRSVLTIAETAREKLRVQEWMTELNSKFELGPTSHAGDAVHALIAHLEQVLLTMGVCNETEILRVGTALHEALVNAIDHGNLELDSELRVGLDAKYHRVRQTRLKEQPYCDRRVYVDVKVTRSQATIRVCDEGPGFDPTCLPDPTDPANLEKPSGRGLMLIRTFMDDVVFNPAGNEITMVKRRVVE